MTYVNGGWTPADEGDYQDEDGDTVGESGHKRRSSARTRRKKDRRLFKGTRWEKKS